MPVVPIADPDDPRVADYRNISDAELIERRGIFIAEGRLVVRRLLEGGRLTTRSLLVTDAGRGAVADLLAVRPEVPAYLVPQTVMNAVTGFNIHRGCLAIGDRPAPVPWRDLVRGARRLVVLERLANADNVGSVFRNAAAFRVGAVLLDTASTDPLYRKAIRTSMGASLSLPFTRVTDTIDLLRDLRRMGIAPVGLTPSPSALPLRDVVAATGGDAVALVLGHEGEGLTAQAMSVCEHLARIPMAPDIDSLNVATAAAIALYELAQAATPPRSTPASDASPRH